MINITMVKKRSQRSVRIFSDKKDPHFANVEVSNPRTGKTERHYILSTDARQWQGIYLRQGFKNINQKTEDTMSIDDKFDAEQYLNFHFGKKTEYSRQITVMAMIRYCYTSTRHLITKAIAGRPKEVRQGFQVVAHDSLYEAAIRIKTEWMTEGLITPSVTDSVGAFDIYMKLKAGIPEDKITPSLFVPGYGSEQDDKVIQN